MEGSFCYRYVSCNAELPDPNLIEYGIILLQSSITTKL